MNHDFYGPAWADHHNKLGDGFEELASATWRAFQRLQARRFAAPWRRRARAPLAK